MILFGYYTSPYVRHCRIALMESGFEWKFEDMAANEGIQESPTKKVPYFTDGALVLTDSSPILKYVRDKSGQDSLVDINDYELYCMSSTLLDTTINVFFLEAGGLSPSQNAYLQRQRDRITSGLKMLNTLPLPYAPTHHYSDGELRLACFLDWSVFHKRISLDEFPNLQNFLNSICQLPLFKDTQNHKPYD